MDSISKISEKINTSDGKSSKNISVGVEEERYSLSDNEQREKLASAFYELAQTDAERDVVSKYKREIESIGKRISRRADLIRGLQEIEGRRGFSGKRSDLKTARASLRTRSRRAIRYRPSSKHQN